jgi:hypothetical protein
LDAPRNVNVRLADAGKGFTGSAGNGSVAGHFLASLHAMILQWDESFDIGSDTLTGVNDTNYKPPFPLTAKLNKPTIKVDRPQLSPEDINRLRAAMEEKAKAD